MSSSFPKVARDRDAWVLSRRGPRVPVDPWKPVAFLIDEEPGDAGSPVSIATLFLANRECPWRCVMCDLWQHALEETVPPGAIPRQIEIALEQLAARRPGMSTPSWIKLYNSGSFFDPRAIPPADHPAIAERVAGFDRVIVECHPALVDERVSTFRRRLPAGTQLELALGLETAHPAVLEKLNKRMTVDQFSAAARYLRDHALALRVFLLVHPPFIDPAEAGPWVRRSIEFAFDSGAGVVSLIPTRLGNGAMEALAQSGDFQEPVLEDLEAALDHGISLGRGRVLADLWDLARFSHCQGCYAARHERLQRMNLTQRLLPRIRCRECGAGNSSANLEPR